MCQRIATFVIVVLCGQDRQVGREGGRVTFRPFQPFPPILPLMFRIIDRYVIRELLLPFALSLVLLTFILVDSAHPAGRGGADRQGHRLDDLPSRARAAPAPGAQPDHSDVGAARDPDRLRPAVGRSRVRGDAGVRRQPLPPDPPRGLVRRRWPPWPRRTRSLSHCPRRIRRSARLPSTSSRIARRATSSRACSTESSPIGPSTRGTSSPAAGARYFWPTPPSPGRRRCTSRRKVACAWIARSKLVALELTAGTWHTTSVTEARRVRGRRLRQHDHSPRSGHGLPQHRAVEDANAR